MWKALVRQVENSHDRPSLVAAIVVLMVTATACLSFFIYVLSVTVGL